MGGNVPEHFHKTHHPLHLLEEFDARGHHARATGAGEPKFWP